MKDPFITPSVKRTPSGTILGRTWSVCPVCLKRISAVKVRRGGEVCLEKECPDHGFFSAVVWRDRVDLAQWTSGLKAPGDEGNPDCPSACGLCSAHLRGTCCVILEVTERCNLRCPFCFADGGARTEDPPLAEITRSLEKIIRPGESLVQLSGGEPTVRDDLPRIVRAAKDLGCRYVQLNTNGLRLASDEPYVKALAQAGLSFVFLQFDGTDDEVYRTLRGRPLFDIKKQAIDRCAEYGIGVTLVPTLVPKVNIRSIGDILRFALAHSPAVRGVHFQPVSYFGRIPRLPADEDRFTLDELMEEIGRQAGDLFSVEDLSPSRCNHPLCGFSGDFIVRRDGTLHSIGRKGGGERGGECACTDSAARKRQYLGLRWERSGEPCGCGEDLTDMDVFLERFRSSSFTVSAMPFQDGGTLDLERLRYCSLHVFRGGKFIPFCACYLSPLLPSE